MEAYQDDTSMFDDMLLQALIAKDELQGFSSNETRSRRLSSMMGTNEDELMVKSSTSLVIYRSYLLLYIQLFCRRVNLIVNVHNQLI